MSFRRIIVAIAALALFVSLASAQLPTNQTLSCTVSSATAPPVRTEGVAELVGDVLLTCSGGPTQAGTLADVGYVNVVVNYQVPVTSRAIGTGTEALLFVDEPGTTGSPFALPVSVCSVATNTAPVAPALTNCAVAVTGGSPNGLTAASNNAYQGFIPAGKPNQLQFNRIPVVTLGGTTYQHVFRISNARLTPTSAQVVASVTVTASTGSTIGLTLTGGNTATVATPQQGLTTSVTAPGISLCNSADLTGTVGSPNLALLTYKEGFNGAFKQQALAVPNQNVTGTYSIGGSDITNLQSESGVEATIVAASDAGLASSPTRLKAVFAGLDKNATYYVSINNIGDFKTAATQRARLLATQGAAGETAAAGVYQALTGTVWTSIGAGIPVAQVTVDSKGKGEVVWEITAPSFTDVDALNFGVYATYNTVTPPTASAASTVQMGFAPTSGATAPGVTTTWIPRFTAPADAGAFAPVLPCQTTLLFPYLASVAGYDTGISIANTSLDPFNTQGKSGTCNLNFYGTGAPAAVTSDSVAPGGSYITLASVIAPGFQGYMIARCDFQFAHGFAFISSPGNNSAMGYLSLVVNSGQRGTTLLGEGLGQ